MLDADFKVQDSSNGCARMGLTNTGLVAEELLIATLLGLENVKLVVRTHPTSDVEAL